MEKKITLLLFLLSTLSILLVLYFFKDTCHRFPRFAQKHKFRALLTPKQQLEYYKKTGKYPSYVSPKTLILCCDDDLLNHVLLNYEHKQCDGCFSDVYFFNDYPSIAIAKFGLTSPWVAMKLDRAIAWGVKQVIFIGTICGLQKNISLGDLLICEKAIRDEGTSHHYLPYSQYVYPSEKFNKRLLDVLKQMGKQHKVGTIWTTDAFFRTTKEEVRRYQKEGVLGVEMETAGILSVASFNHVDMIAIFTITDSYANLRWEKALEYKDKKLKTLESFVEIALNVADVKEK